MDFYTLYIIFLDFYHYSHIYIFYRLGCSLLISYLGLKAVFCQTPNYSKTNLDIYIHQVWLSWVTHQDLYYLANTFWLIPIAG